MSTTAPANPTALLTSDSYTAFVYTYDPYGVATLTVDAGGSGPSQNPYLFKGGLQDRTTGRVHFGARWYNPPPGAGHNKTPSTRR